YSATQHVREAVGVDKPSAGNGLTTDMSTLKSARESMASMDRVSKLSRQQMFASSYLPLGASNEMRVERRADADSTNIRRGEATLTDAFCQALLGIAQQVCCDKTLPAL
ncbi:MAG: hypothetical protein ACXWJD_13525, partial [Burkholderiaceae bacterium]